MFSMPDKGLQVLVVLSIKTSKSVTSAGVHFNELSKQDKKRKALLTNEVSYDSTLFFSLYL